MRHRARVLRLCSILSVILSVVSTVSSTNNYGVPIEIKVWDTSRPPLAHMVDVTNEFSLKVLAEHNFLNDNNIAFSPYGLIGILIALYEGVDGESSYQIRQAMQLPWNRNVMRIGFRDIHRTLKTYFVPEEGFLAGLALNNENVTFNENYKKVLRFYGFDLDNDQLPTFPPETNNPNISTTLPTSTMSEASTTSASFQTNPFREESTTDSIKEDTTPNINAETVNEVENIKPISTTNSESTSTLSANVDQLSTTEPSSESTVPISAESTTMALNGNTPTPSTDTSDSSTERITEVSESITTPELTSTVTTTVTESTILSTTDANTQSDSTTATMTDTQQTETTTMTDVNTEATIATTIETLERKKKSIVDFIFTDPSYLDDYMSYRNYDDIDVRPTSFYGTKMFLANGLRNVEVTYMHYDTDMEHAFLPHLEASALKLPLDSDRYYLLVVLPWRESPAELERLIARMARESDLRDVYAALKPKRVKAVVPSFTVKGHVTLTIDLQKIGIRNVFEPRQRDFTPMTPQMGVYVRSIEQAVSVAIRKYRPDEEHMKNRYMANRQPVYFSATYPFMYFVMDSSIHVTLMAGKLVDPLNSRVL